MWVRTVETLMPSARDRGGVETAGEQLQYLPLARRQLLYPGRHGRLRLGAGLRAEQVDEPAGAGRPYADRRGDHTLPPRSRADEQGPRRDVPAPERGTGDRATGVTDDTAVVVHAFDHAPAGSSERRLLRDAGQLLGGSVPGCDAQLLVDDEERIAGTVLLNARTTLHDSMQAYAAPPSAVCRTGHQMTITG